MKSMSSPSLRHAAAIRSAPPSESLESSPTLQEAVRAEVARQVEGLRAQIERELAALRERTVDHRATLVVFSGDLDRVLAAFVIATGAAAMGLETSMFFTFWGLSALRRGDAERRPQDLYERLFALMTADSPADLGVSRGNFFGIGAAMLRRAMRKKDVASLEDLMQLARDSGIKMTACSMSMEVMGIRAEELQDGVEIGGAASYLADAASARVTLFV